MPLIFPGKKCLVARGLTIFKVVRPFLMMKDAPGIKAIPAFLRTLFVLIFCSIPPARLIQEPCMLVFLTEVFTSQLMEGKTGKRKIMGWAIIFLRGRYVKIPKAGYLYYSPVDKEKV